MVFIRKKQGGCSEWVPAFVLAMVQKAAKENHSLHLSMIYFLFVRWYCPLRRNKIDTTLEAFRTFLRKETIYPGSAAASGITSAIKQTLKVRAIRGGRYDEKTELKSLNYPLIYEYITGF